MDEVFSGCKPVVGLTGFYRPDPGSDRSPNVVCEVKTVGGAKVVVVREIVTDRIVELPIEDWLSPHEMCEEVNALVSNDSFSRQEAIARRAAMHRALTLITSRAGRPPSGLSQFGDLFMPAETLLFPASDKPAPAVDPDEPTLPKGVLPQSIWTDESDEDATAPAVRRREQLLPPLKPLGPKPLRPVTPFSSLPRKKD